MMTTSNPIFVYLYSNLTLNKTRSKGLSFIAKIEKNGITISRENLFIAFRARCLERERGAKSDLNKERRKYVFIFLYFYKFYSEKLLHKYFKNVLV